MSNRPKLKKVMKKLTQDEEFRKSMEKLTEMINESLNKMSPGARWVTAEEPGTFYIFTPSQKIIAKSLSYLGMMMSHPGAGIGEQALINAVNRVNKLMPLIEDIGDPLPDEQKMSLDEFVTAFESGLDLQLRFLLDRLTELPEGSAEGDMIGYTQATTLSSQISHLKARIQARGSNAPMEILVGSQWLPIPSPTVLGFVLKYARIPDHDELVKALVLTGIIIKTPLFPEWQRGSEGGKKFYRYSED